MSQDQKTLKQVQPPARDEITRRAYFLWEKAGRPYGRDQEFWLQAETQFAAEKQKAVVAPQPIQSQPVSIATARMDKPKPAVVAAPPVITPELKPRPAAPAAPLPPQAVKKQKSSARR